MAGRSAAVAAPEPVAAKPAVKSKPSTMFGGASSKPAAKPAAKPAKAAPASLVTSWYDTGVRLDTGVVKPVKAAAAAASGGVASWYDSGVAMK